LVPVHAGLQRLGNGSQDRDEDDSWLLLRASGTEPVLRIYAEAPYKEKVEDLIQEAKKLIGG